MEFPVLAALLGTVPPGLKSPCGLLGLGLRRTWAAGQCVSPGPWKEARSFLWARRQDPQGDTAETRLSRRGLWRDPFGTTPWERVHGRPGRGEGAESPTSLPPPSILQTHVLANPSQVRGQGGQDTQPSGAGRGRGEPRGQRAVAWGLTDARGRRAPRYGMPTPQQRSTGLGRVPSFL